MLKLTNSFCRYLKVSYDKISYPNVKKISYLSCRRDTCGTELHTKLSVQWICTRQLHKLEFNNKLEYSNEKKLVPMSGSHQPTINHASYGGYFQISEEPLPGPSNEQESNFHVALNTLQQCVQSIDFRDLDQRHSKSQSDNCGCESDTYCKHVVNSEFKKKINDPANIKPKHISRTVPPDFRTWEQVNKGSIDGNTLRFRVVSYNVLAQFLLECHPILYKDCAPENLKWKVRSTRLYNEIKALEPDVLCLQEVQASHLDSFYSKFEQIGYKGVFKKKTGFIQSRHDGCAIYYKQSIFDLGEHVNVEYFQPGFPILNRDNIGILVKLIPKNSPLSPVVVATTHLLYNPNRPDVRLAQMRFLLAELDRFAYYNNGQESGHYPIILTGDFNSTIDSSVINLLNNGKVCGHRDRSDWTQIGVTDNCQHLSVHLSRNKDLADPNLNKAYNSMQGTDSSSTIDIDITKHFRFLFNGEILSHSLCLVSAYEYIKPNGQYEVSTFQDYWVLVDYIYFRCSQLRLVERYRLPTQLDCILHIGRLPNDVYGSDHLVLAATFELAIPNSYNKE